jgi:hypothetical protein
MHVGTIGRAVAHQGSAFWPNVRRTCTPDSFFRNPKPIGTSWMRPSFTKRRLRPRGSLSIVTACGIAAISD